MLIGDPKSFAVEIYHEPAGPQWLGFGRICVYVQGVVLGDVNEEHCSLFHPVKRICEIADSLTTLWDSCFAGLTEEEVFSKLDALLYTGDLVGKPDAFYRFDFLTNTGEPFDGEKSFIYCTPEGVVNILFDENDLVLRKTSCTPIAFQSVAAELGKWFERQTTKQL